LRIGSLHTVLPSVFAVGRAALEPLGAEIAALLYVGDDCVLSHATAAALWGLSPPRDLVEITLAGRNVRQRPELRVYRVAELDARDVRLRDGIPVTAPARTLIDFAASALDDDLQAALSEARVLRLITDGDLRLALERCPTRSGSARLRRFLRAETGRLKTRRAAERLLLSLLSKAGLPRPEANVHVHGFEVDFVWRDAKLIVETDGYQFHSHRSAFERDRRRDQVLVAAGYRVIRVTWRQLEREPLAVVARIAQALAFTAS
jgi:very-short-patch-repair endonuclease